MGVELWIGIVNTELGLGFGIRAGDLDSGLGIGCDFWSQDLELVELV